MGKWVAVSTDDFQKDFSSYQKKRPNELKAVFSNLQTLLEVLEVTNGPAKVSCSFFKSEGKGLFRISESGGGRSLQPTRLYITCEVKEQRLILLRILPKGAPKKQSEQISALQKQISKR